MLIHMITKDLKRFFKDRSALITIIAMPIVIMTILGLALAGMFSNNNTMESIKIAVVKEYKTGYGIKDLTSDLSKSPFGAGMLQGDYLKEIELAMPDVDPEKLFFKDFLENKEVKRFVSYDITTLDEAKSLIASDKIAGYVVLPENYQKDMTLNLLTPFRNPVSLTMVPNPERTFSPAIMKALIDSFVNMTDQMIAQKNVMIEQSIAYDLTLDFGKLMDNRSSQEPDAKLITILEQGIKGSNPIDSKAYYAISMLSMFLLFAAALGGTWLLEEKELNTYDRQRAAGFSKLSIALSKLILIYLVVVIQIAVLIAYSSLVLGVTWGNGLNIFIITVVTVFGIGGLGLLLSVVSSIANSYQLTKIFESGVIQVLALFGGSYLPVDQLPAVIGVINKGLINGAVLKAYLNNMMGYSLNELLPLIGVIGLNGLVFTLLAIVLFIREEVRTDAAYSLQKTVDAKVTN